MAPNNTSSNGASQVHWEQLIAACGRQQLPAAKEKVEETGSKLGTYEAAVTPTLVLLLGICCGVYSYWDLYMDPRVKGWLLIEDPVGMFVISMAYILASVVWGPRWMKNRKPMELKYPMIVYNALQVVFSFYMFIETGLVGWFFDYNFRCQPCDYSYNDKPVRMTRVAHWFFLSKFLDFFDTAFFILRGKLSQVSMLHVIHHSCMFMSMWFGVRYQPGGHMTFMGLLNTFVHTVMYLYYLLAAMGPRVRPYLWWKRYLTRLQLTQFVLIFLHAAQLLVFPCEGVPTSLVMWTLLYAFIFFALFVNFYVKAYRLGKDKKKRISEQQQLTSTKSNGELAAPTDTEAYSPYSRSTPTTSSQDSNGNISSFMDSRARHRLPNGATIAN